VSTVLYGQALLAPESEIVLRAMEGPSRPFHAHQWNGPLDDADRAVVERIAGATIDVGCGPGRFVSAAVERGLLVLGIDIAPVAVAMTQRRGAPVLLRDVFGDVPGVGRWDTALLMDGNVGIGGDPIRLLRRTGELLRPGGTVIVEVQPPGSPVGVQRVRLESRVEIGAWFAWATESVDTISAAAIAAGLVPEAPWCTGGRWFAELVRP
jgi:SAM-dependent methyltransferase